jgi:hypothetical protein
MRRRITVLAALAAVAAGAPPAAAAEPAWQLVDTLTDGSPYPRPIGRIGGFAFAAPNRGVLTTEGTEAVKPGIWSYDGERWQPLADVCGGNADRADVVWASSKEFWAIADPAPNPLAPRPTYPAGARRDEGTTLCDFKDGRVAASYAAPPAGPSRWYQMTSAACLAGECLFGGYGSRGEDGRRLGTFHLRTTGGRPEVVWGAQGRGVTALAAHRGALYESVASGERPYFRGELADPRPAEPQERLLLGWGGSTFVTDPFVARPLPKQVTGKDRAGNTQTVTIGKSPGQQETEDVLADLRALSSDGELLWAVGGTSDSGLWGQGDPLPNSNQCPGSYYRQRHAGMFSPRPPLVAVKPGDGPFQELRFSDDDIVQSRSRAAEPFSWPTIDQYELYGDVAAIPGRPNEAWVAALPWTNFGCFQLENQERAYERSRWSTDNPVLVRLRYLPDATPGQPNVTVVERVDLERGERRGAVRRVACTGPGDCWAATTQGWLYHYTDGSGPGRDPAPPFPERITQRPLDERAALIADTPPVDDSLANAPKPIYVDAPEPPPAPPVIVEPQVVTKDRPPLIEKVKVANHGSRALRLDFQLARPAKVGVAAELRGRDVGQAKLTKLDPGDARLILRFDPKRRPGRLRFRTVELAPDAPTLAGVAGRAGATVAATATLPAAGRLRVSVLRAGRVVARRTVRGRGGPVTAAVPVPRTARRGELEVRFSYGSLRFVRRLRAL